MGDFEPVPGEAGLAPIHGFGVVSWEPAPVISSNGGPLTWLKLLFRAGNLWLGVVSEAL